MTDPFVAEIRVFGFNFPPTGWAFCNGQIMPISQNTALFSLLGTTYGGNGQSTFALPNLEGRAPLQQGQGPSLSDRFLGEEVGSENVTLIQSEMPQHAHVPMSAVDPAEQAAPAADRSLTRAQPGLTYRPDSGESLVPLAPEAASIYGGDLPHNNMPPYLTLNYCIALQGVFPPRP